jgi:uncharacterized Zn-binding protein involved in type VI secretion
MLRGYFIREGDRTECGGQVMEGDRRVNMFGVIHAREGDRVTCGKDGNVYQIVGGVSFIDSFGKPPAGTLDSFSTCPCRARLIASSYKSHYLKEDNYAPPDANAQADNRLAVNHKISNFPAEAKASDYLSCPVPAACNHADRMEELASYIADEMNRNISHPSVLKMKELNSYDPEAEAKKIPFYLRFGHQPNYHSIALAKQAEAFVLWTERVGQNRPWDHKVKIKALFGGSVRHKQGKYDYFYDIWSNIHYGYVGIAAGFSESVLLDGAGAEQIVSDSLRKIQDWEGRRGPYRSEGVDGLRAWDDIPDRKSIIIGLRLFGIFPQGGVNAKVIMDEVLAGDQADWGEGIRDHECE